MKSLKRTLTGFLASVLALGLLSACNQETNTPSQETTKTVTPAQPAIMGVGLVDTDQVFSQSLPGKAAIAHLENVGKGLQEEFIKLQDSLKEKDEKSLTNFQKQASKLEQRYKAEEQQVMSAIENLYQESLDKVRGTENLQLIIAKSSALSFSNNSEVTAKVIEQMDKSTLTFKNLPQESVESAEASEAAPSEQATPAKKNNEPAPAQQAPTSGSNSTAKPTTKNKNKQ